MKICVLTTSYPRTSADDAGIFVKRLVEEMTRSGHSAAVIVPHDGHEPRQEQDGRIDISRVRYWPGGRKLAFGSGILPNLRKRPYLAIQLPLLVMSLARRAFMERKRTDIYFANWLLSGLSAWLVSLMTRKPYAITLRGEDVRFVRNPITRFFFAPCLKRAAFVVTVSEEFKRLTMRIIPGAHGRVHWIPNGVAASPPVANPLRGAARPRPPKGATNLVYVGRLIPLKRIEVLIDLLALLPSGWHLVLCGHSADHGYRRFLEKRIAEHGLGQRVTFTGRIAPDEVGAYLASARYYITASCYEGRSNSLVEALAAGLVVAASDIPGHREVIVKGENGLLFDPQNLGGLRDELLQLENDRECYEIISERSKAYAAQFSWSNCATRYLELFESCREAGAEKRS